MNLPPDLDELERLLAATRAALPAGLRERVLSTCEARAPGRRERILPMRWFAASVAIAAAAALCLNSSSELALPDGGSAPAGSLYRSALPTAFGGAAPSDQAPDLQPAAEE